MIIRPLVSLGFGAAAVLAGSLAATTTDRQVYNLNPDWRFLRADAPEAVRPDFDDSKWAHVSLPHTWNDVDTFNNFGSGGHQGESDLWTGVAWYRKEFTLPAGDGARRVFIEFEGVRQLAEVYLNGHKLGGNQTGFIPFGFDLTPHLKFGGRNVLVVRADNRFDHELYAGATPWHHPNWHPPHGGIYRNVRLQVLDPLHVTLPLYANLQTEGIYARTISLTRDLAEVKITAEVENGNAAAVDGSVTLSVVDREGRVAAAATVPIRLAAGARDQVTALVAVRDPHLWEPAYPQPGGAGTKSEGN